MAAPTYEASLVAVVPQLSGPPTFTEVAAIIPTSLTILDVLGQPGRCDITTQVSSIESAGRSRLIDLSVTPTELWVRRGTSTIVFAGNVTGYHLHDKEITITAPGLLAYLLYWFIDFNVLGTLNGSAATEYGFNLIDQAVIVQRLCDAWQAQAYGNDGIVTIGLAATGVPRILNLSARDGKFMMPVLTEMGGRNNGFDLSVDPNTRRLTMWSPRKGTDRSAGPSAVILDARSIGVPDIQASVAPGLIGSECFASSSSTTGSTYTSVQSNATLRQTFGRSYITKSFEDISEQTTLDDHAARAVNDAATQVVTMAPELMPVAGFSYGDFFTGDIIMYDYDAGLGRQTFTPRVNSIQVSTATGREVLTVGLV